MQIERKLYDSRGFIKGTFSRLMASLRPPIRGEFAIGWQSSFGICSMWLLKASFVFDCLIK